VLTFYPTRLFLALLLQNIKCFFKCLFFIFSSKLFLFFNLLIFQYLTLIEIISMGNLFRKDLWFKILFMHYIVTVLLILQIDV